MPKAAENEDVSFIFVEGFSKLNFTQRIDYLIREGFLSPSEAKIIAKKSSLNDELINHFIENAIGNFPVPLGVAVNFVIDHKTYVIPMATEETSIIAAASKTAKWLSQSGEISTNTVSRLAIGQIQFPKVRDADALSDIILTQKDQLLEAANQEIASSMIARGGGVKDLSIRKLLRPDGQYMVIIHVMVDTRDAMGANMINQVCEFLKPHLEQLTQEKVGLCILSNLTDQKITEAHVIVRNIEPELGKAIEEASLFAQLDPYRAATNNKGILNAVDAILLATGNDWRAVEAGMHAYAARFGHYSSLSQWSMNGTDLHGTLAAPVVTGIVGGVTHLHPVAKIALKLLRVENAEELSRIIAAAGLVQNLGALRALVTHGIINGHMKLHINNLALAAGATKEELPLVIGQLQQVLNDNRHITSNDIQSIMSKLRNHANHFETTAHAKCILAGEHTVLRGGAAIVLPVQSKNISFSYDQSDKKISVVPKSRYEDIFLLLFWKTLEKALRKVNKNVDDLYGKVSIMNSIEMGAGLGFSAALCVVIARFLAHEHWIGENEIFNFAHHLEDLFHGKSSGVDIVGVMAEHPIHFEKGKQPVELEIAWKPKLYLTYSGMDKDTTYAINQVQSLLKDQPELAAAIDEQMKTSVSMIEEALKKDAKDGLPLLKAGIEQAKNCFKQWGLIPHEMQRKMNMIYQMGALAVKPTGAGGGGYLLSLWDKEPPRESGVRFEAVFL